MNRTLILFASKSGTTKRVAESMMRALAPDCDCYDLRRGVLQTPDGKITRKPSRLIDLSGYCAIALGSAMYMGRPLNPYLRFCRKRAEELLRHPLYLFTCGLATAEEEQPFLWPLLPAQIAEHAGHLYHLGGEIRANGGWFSSMVLADYEKKYHTSPSIDQKAVDGLIAALRSNLKSL